MREVIVVDEKSEDIEYAAENGIEFHSNLLDTLFMSRSVAG